MNPAEPIKAVLFDLDGTLLDTAPDLGYALNQTLHLYGKAPLPHEQIRPWASHGARGLLALGFDDDSESDSFAELRKTFLDIYAENLLRDTCLFEGMAEVLVTLENQGLPWGIVTNKPMAYTDPLVAQFNWPNQPACVISGDSTPLPKPDPGAIHLACSQMDIPASACVYVGDADRDITAGVAAGMPSLAALWGYIQDHEQPDTWGASALLNNPAELLTWLEDHG